MRNYPIVPKAQQQAMTEAEIILSASKPKTEKVAFKSSVDNGYKAYEMVNGEYLRYTIKAYPTKEIALQELELL